MPVKVLIVDDSGFFRQRINGMLEQDPRIKVIGTASNGREAIEQVKALRPDVVTMDVEMPQLNGIEAVRIIMRECPTNVLMLSSLTHEGAHVTLQALEAGAVDYISKDVKAWIDKADSLRSQLADKIVEISRATRYRAGSGFRNRDPGTSSSSTSMVFRHNERPAAKPTQRGVPPKPAAPRTPTRTAPAPRAGSALSSASAPAVTPRKSSPSRVQFPDCKIVVIGSSTGGPAALQEILTKLPANFPYPILLVQHMPKTFTSVFAERLNQQCKISVKEAQDGDRLEPGKALLAPGGHQMILDGRQHDTVKILKGDERLTYKPSVDVTYASAAKGYGSKTLALILTGMGADGCDGAKVLKNAGATVWAQNRESCTIYGMPQAVVNAGLADEILDLKDIGPILGNRGAR